MRRLAVAHGLALVLAVAVAACSGEVGLMRIDLVTAPGSDLLERIERARLELSSPPTVVEAERGADGRLVLELEVVAEGQGALLTLEGYDAGGELVGLGLSAPLPIAAVDADLSLYVAPPLGFTGAPVDLDPARSEIGAARLPYGGVLAGGRDAAGAPVAALEIYNVYDHALQRGLDLPEPRAAMAVATGASDFIYLMGGEDAGGQPRHEAWRFDTALAPAGGYTGLASPPALARAGASAAHIGGDQFLVTGDPPAQMDPGQVRAIDGPSLEGGVAVALSGQALGPVLVIGAGVGEAGAALHRAGSLEAIDAPDTARRTGHAAALLPDGRALVVGGEDDGGPTTAALLFRQAPDTFTVLEDFLAEPRTGAALAVTRDHVVVAGGTGAAGPLATAEIFDAETLEPVATLPLAVPRTGAVAIALPNRQVLVAGGLDASGQPIATLELFTPPR